MCTHKHCLRVVLHLAIYVECNMTIIRLHDKSNQLLEQGDRLHGCFDCANVSAG